MCSFTSAQSSAPAELAQRRSKAFVRSEGRQQARQDQRGRPPRRLTQPIWDFRGCTGISDRSLSDIRLKPAGQIGGLFRSEHVAEIEVCLGGGFLARAGQFPAKSRTAAHRGARLPRQAGQVPRHGLTAASARSQDVADIVGKPAHFRFHQSGDRIHQVVEPLPPTGSVEQIDARSAWRIRCRKSRSEFPWRP